MIFQSSIFVKHLPTFAMCIYLVLASSLAVSAEEARFEGDVVVEFENPGEITVLSPLTFVDRENRRWRVPSGFVSDGASIPPHFYSFFGGPFSGKYLKPAIIHDYFCERRAHDWDTVHKVFYEAMIAAEVPPAKAWVMYMAVDSFGPRWTTTEEIPSECPLPDSCILNNGGDGQQYRREITEENMAVFLDKLRAQGYAEQAQNLEQLMLKEF